MIPPIPPSFPFTPIPDLGEDRIITGRKILEITDRVGFHCMGAAWIVDERIDGTEDWKFCLVTRSIDHYGLIWIWQRLNQVFQHITLPDSITPMDLIVASPNWDIFSGMQVTIQKGEETHFGGMKITDMFGTRHLGPQVAYLYRWTPEQDVRAKSFDRSVRALAA